MNPPEKSPFLTLPNILGCLALVIILALIVAYGRHEPSRSPQEDFGGK